MEIDFLVEKAVTKRYSVRNYSEREIVEEKRKAIMTFIASLDNPFHRKVKLHYFNRENSNEKVSLGTYGVIKGAKNYVGASIKLEPMALEALGYEFEAVILYLAHLGLGTCWLGGTFKRKGFANVLKVEDGDILPIISPFGYAAEKKHIIELAMRKISKAEQRKNWHELFFAKDFKTPLDKEGSGDLAFPLAMVRLGPSASNKQPWRILVQEKACHFYEYKAPGYSDIFSYDIQNIDLGIAAAHFDFSTKEKGIKGHFATDLAPSIKLPKNVAYRFTWLRD